MEKISSQEAVSRIAGSIVVNDQPGRALKSWREKLGIKQIELARAMGLAASVLSDYESGRRPSPGVQFVRRYVECLISLDETKNRMVPKLISFDDGGAILSIGEFQKPVDAKLLVNAVKGQVLSGEVDGVKIYGYTVLDSIRTIYALSGYDFYRIFGSTTERALVFTKVGMGRSPLVAVRVSQLKPRMIVIHGPRVIDTLAVELAKKERIILVLSNSNSESEIIKALSSIDSSALQSEK
jgi:putative transcriptional regulator